MIKLWLLNHKEEIKETVELISAIHSQSVNGANTLVFECTNHVEKLDHVLYQDEQSHWHEFIVHGITENKETISVYAEHASYELHSFYVKDRRPTETPSSHLQTLLEGTRWSVGTVEKGEPIFVSYYYLTIYDAIAKLVENCKGELNYRITVSGNKITGRYVDILNRVGVDAGKRFTYRKDLKNVTRTILDDEIYTALVGRGRGEEIGDGYGRRITFADLSKPDSPVGIEYVFDSNALSQWGIEHNGQILHRIGIVEFDDIDDKEELYNATKELLEKYSSPQVNYKVEVALLNGTHENVAIGDSVFIFDKDFRGQELRLNGRIIRFDKNLVHPEESVVTIGQLIGNLATRQAQIEDFINQFRSKSKIWDRSNAFDSNNSLEASYIKNLLQEWNDRANASGGYTYAVEGQGQITYDRPIDQEPTQALQIVGGTMRIANSKLPNGDWNWRTVMNADGIAGQEIITQSITANQLRSDVGASLDLSSNESIRFVVDSVIDDLDFEDGKDAYEIAVSLGFTGTRQEWLNSLRGEDGTSVRILGSREDSSLLPTTGNTLGDGYIVQGDLWIWTEEQIWHNAGRIQGQNGRDGIGYQLLLTSDEGLSYNPSSDIVSYNLRANVILNNQNVTSNLDNSYFVWRRISNDDTLDQQFNVQGLTGKVLNLSKEYMQESAAYECTLTIPSVSGYMLDGQGQVILDGQGRRIIATSYSLQFKQQLPITTERIDQLEYLSTELNIAKGRLDLTLTEATLTSETIIGKINASPSHLKIDWTNIELEGYTSINGKVQITDDGYFKAVDGEFSGLLDVHEGLIGGFTIANDGLRKSLTKTFGPFVQSDYQTLSNIIQSGTQPTSAQLNKFDINGDGALNSFDLVRLSRILNGQDPNPYTVTFTIKLNTQNHADMISLINSTSPSNSTSIGTQGIKTPTVFTNNIENLNRITTLSEGNFTIVDSKGDNLFRSGKDTTGVIMATIPNLATGNFWANTVNSVRIAETTDGFYLLAKTGKLIGINQTGVYAGTMSSTQYIHTF